MAQDGAASSLQLTWSRQVEQHQEPFQPRTVVVIGGMRSRDVLCEIGVRRQDFPWMCGIATPAEVPCKVYRAKARWLGCGIVAPCAVVLTTAVAWTCCRLLVILIRFTLHGHA